MSQWKNFDHPNHPPTKLNLFISKLEKEEILSESMFICFSWFLYACMRPLWRGELERKNKSFSGVNFSV